MHPVDKNKLTVALTAGPIIGRTFENREEGIISRGLEDSVIFLSKSMKSSKLIG